MCCSLVRSEAVPVAPRLISRGVKDLFSNPWAQALTLAVVTLVTFLGGLFLLLLHNLDTHLVATQGQVQFQVFWESGADMGEVRKQWDEIARMDRLESVRTFTPEMGLSLIEASLAQGVDLGWLKEDNPIPPTALIRFNLGRDDPELASRMLSRLQAMPGVDTVHYNPLQLDLARSWMGFTRTVMWPLIAFLTLILGLVVGNTFKLSLLHRTEEIELLRMVGATRWYIQLPLVIGGLVQGIVGGCLALGMLKLVQISLADLLHLPPLWITITFLPLNEVLLVLGVLALVGMGSSWVAVRK